MAEIKMANHPQKKNFSSQPHPALTNFVTLKSIFGNLSTKELWVVRSVCSHWNFVAMSALVSRKYTPSLLRLSESQSRVYSVHPNTFLEFEIQRRAAWTTLYGFDYPLIEFRKLEFISFWGSHTLTNFFEKALELQLLTSVTSLTMPMFESHCRHSLSRRILPSFPNLKNLSCVVRPDSASSQFVAHQNLTDDHNAGKVTFGDEPSVESQAADEPELKHANLHNVSLYLDAAFPWILLESFPKLNMVHLEFHKAAVLINCVKNLVLEIPVQQIQSLRIMLTFSVVSPLDTFQKQISREQLVHTEAYATAIAELCNHFSIQNGLSVACKIPAAYIFLFLKTLKPVVMATFFELEVAAPLGAIFADRTLADVGRWLVPEIDSKFPQLKVLYLRYFQYIPYTPVIVLEREISSQGPIKILERLEKLVISTPLSMPECANSSELQYLPLAIYGNFTVLYAGFQQITQLEFVVASWMDCTMIVDVLHLNSIRIKHLTLIGKSYVLYRDMLLVCFFPDIDRSKYPGNRASGSWPSGSRVYHGLPGLKTLETLAFQNFGTPYHPLVEAQVKRMPSLKAIYFDATINPVDPLHSHSGSESLKWPPEIGNVLIFAINNMTRLSGKS